MKKNFTILTIMAMAFIMPFTINANTWNGSTDTEWRSAGTNAYYIDTAEELAGLASKVRGGTTYSGYTFYLTANLNLNGSSYNWDPIGYWNALTQVASIYDGDREYFCGTFDGQGYSITNCKVNISVSSAGKRGNNTGGVFGAVKGATIRNLQVTNSNIYVSHQHFYVYCGAVVGWADNSSVIENCSAFNNTISAYAPWKVGFSYGYAYAAGICGASENSTVKNCYVYGNSITADGSKKDYSATTAYNYKNATLSGNTEYASASAMTSGIVQKAQAQNNQIHMWNNWGAGTKPTTGNDGTHYYMLDESTGTPTNKIYLAVDIKAADAASVSKEENVTISNNEKISYTYNGTAYNLYLKGSTVTAVFYPLGYTGKWDDHGNYVNFGSNPAIVNNLDVYENNRYERKQTVSQTLSSPIISSYGVTYTAPSTAEDMTQKVKAINRSTIIYNNFGADAVGAAEPKTPYFIDEQTWKPTDKIYYAYTGITNAENVTAEVASTTEAFICDGVDNLLYYAGQNIDVNIKYTLPGYKGDWTDHGCYVAKTLLNDAECTIASTTISNNISEEGYNGERYARTQEESFSIVMPNAPASFSYTTATTHAKAENVAQKVAAINRATIIYNNFGADAEGAVVPKTPYFIDEATFMPTDKIYYTYSSITDLENITSDVTVVTEGFNYTGIESPLYYAGQELDFTVKFGLPGYKGDWTDHGCYIAQAFVNGTECDITGTTVSNSISEEGYNGERYARTQEVAFKATMPGAPITLSYATSDTHEQAEDVSEAVKAINRATIIYNNFGADAEGAAVPKTPYFIDEATFMPTDKIYYTYSSITDLENITSDVTVVTEGFNYTGIESTLYYAGQELDFTVKFGLPGYKGDWTDHGCYVAQAFVNGTECDITSTTVSNSISEEGYEGERYARTQEVAFKATMPEAPITLSYATSESHEQAEDVSEAVKAINNATIEYNNWGVGEAPKTPYFIDETTLKPTDKIYYAVTFYDDRDNILQVPSLQVSEQAKVYTYQDTEYTLYPTGSEVTIDTYPIGYSADWSSKGYYLNTVYSMSNSAELPIAASNVSDDLQNITDGNYHRTHTATVKLPETSNGPITLYCSVAETAPENAVFNDITEDVTNINNATIIYNNWGVGEEPATPYYIEQNGNSFVKSDKIYYAFEPAVLNPEGNRETTGVRSEAEYVHTENKKTFTYNETEYPLYANGDIVGIKCYLDGFTMEMEDNNEGWKVAQVNENNANAWEISEDSEYAEIIADITNEEGFDNETERFCREHTVFVTVPLVTEMRRQPISLTYTTAGKIKDDTATSIEDITGDATYAHGVITSDGIIEVYNINGILVARKKNQVNMAELNSGIYLVRCGNKTMKIVR